MLTGKIKEYYETNGYNVTIYTLENLIINEILFKNDFYILKSKSLFFLYAGFFLNENDIPVIPNPYFSFLQKNRLQSHFLIQKAGLLAPIMYYGTPEMLIEQLESDIFPLILKPVVGSGSRGVKIISSFQDLKREDKKILYLEKFINGIHYTVYFIGEQICTLIKPPLSDEHVKMEKIKTPKDIKDIIKKWKLVLGVNQLFGHLDIVRSESDNELFVVDPGSFPEFSNWKCGNSTVKKICDLILNQVEKIKNTPKN